VLVVDDGSTDNTRGVAAAAGAQVVRQEPNQGKGAALRAGFKWALDHDYAAVITLDADGQHDPAEISGFLELQARSQADLIIGARDFSKMPPVRRWANTTGQKLFSWALGEPVQDNQSGYRLISRQLMAAVLESTESGFEFEVEMIVVCVRRGMKLAWVPIRTIYGDQGSHIKPLHHAVQFMRVIWQTWRSR